MRVGIYCRISYDRNETGLGVGRQERDCRDLVRRRDWEVAEVYVDNDLSAYVTARRHKQRPGYQALTEAIRDQELDAVVVWHPDRLHRSPRELEDFIDLIESTHTTVVTVTAGDYDLGTPDGRLMARITGSVARKESEDKSRRLRRKHLELAENGKIAGGGRRPFGYEADRRTIKENEAAEIRSAAEAVVAGQSIWAVAADWRERDVPSVTGAPWSSTTVRRLLRSGRISGQREHHGVITAKADWPAIVSREVTAGLRAVIDDPSRRVNGQRSAREYLLAGFVRCGICGARMGARPVYRKGIRYRRYFCSSDRGGCNRVGIGAQPLEDLIAEAVMLRLDSPALAEGLAKGSQDALSPVEARVEELEKRVAELAEMWATGVISRAEWSVARGRLVVDLDRAQAELARATRSQAARPLVKAPGLLRTAWAQLSLDRRRAVLAEIVESVVIAPTTRQNNRFDPSRADVRWRA